MEKNIMYDSIINEHIWEFSIDRKNPNQLTLKQIYHVNSQNFTNIECIEQWNFVIPESNIQCDDPKKLINIRNNNIECKATIVDGKVNIE